MPGPRRGIDSTYEWERRFQVFSFFLFCFVVSLLVSKDFFAFLGWEEAGGVFKLVFTTKSWERERL